MNAITVVAIVTFFKTTKKTLICLHRGCAPFSVSLQQGKEQKGRERIRNGMNKRTDDNVCQVRGRQRISTSVIRERCHAPQLKVVHCSVELVRDYCCLHPTLNLSCGSGSAPSYVRLFEVWKSCSHVLLIALSLCLSVCFCLSYPVFLSLVLPASPQHRGGDLEHCILFVLCPLFSSNFGTWCRLGFEFEEALKLV